MAAGSVEEPLGVDAVGLGFNSTFGAVGPFSSLPNHPEKVGCKSQIKPNAANMIRASLEFVSSLVLRLIVKFFQKTKIHLLENPTKSLRF